jgi:hypothetical protein
MKEPQMSPSNVTGEAIGAAFRHLATVTIWVILVIALVVVIDTGLRALRGRQEMHGRDQAADHEAVTRRVLVQTTPRPGSWVQLAPLLPRRRPNRDQVAAESSPDRVA